MMSFKFTWHFLDPQKHVMIEWKEIRVESIDWLKGMKFKHSQRLFNWNLVNVEIRRIYKADKAQLFASNFDHYQCSTGKTANKSLTKAENKTIISITSGKPFS